MIKHKLSLLFIAKVGTHSYFWNILKEERYELKKWFLPLVQGVFVDVGAYIGKYSIFAYKDKKVDKVIAIELAPLNFAILKANVKLNSCEKKVVLVNEAIDSVEGLKHIHIPVTVHGASFINGSPS